jgi:hypothetical protein
MEKLFIDKIINPYIVFGVVFVIEVLKQAMKKASIAIADNKDAWKIIVFFAGAICSLIDFGMANWYELSVWKFIYLSLLYSAASTFLYQTGKLAGLTIQRNIFVKKDD